MKRKIKDNSQSRSRKRVSIEKDSQITINSQDEEQWVPVIASLSSIDIDPSTKFKPYLKNRKTSPRDKSIIMTQELLLHSSGHSKIDYIANEEEDGGVDALMKHYIGVYDPSNGKLEVLEARNMVIRGIIRAHQSEEHDIVSKDIRAQRNILGQTFGTKKARKAISSVTENAISPSLSLRNATDVMQVSSATATVLSSVAMATKEMTSINDLAKAADDLKPRPKPNEDATKIQDVYTIDSLIGSTILKMIPVKEWQDKVKSNEEVFVSSKYVANRIQNCIKNVEKLKILRFMLMLFELYQKSRLSKEGRRLPRREDLKKMIGNIPDAVIGAVKRKFTENGIINKYHGDLIITHLCAMALLIDDFQTDTCDLKEDLQFDLSQITKYYSEIGVRSHSLSKNDVARYGKVIASQRRVAKLKLPLVFPKLLLGRRK